jgi:hypothetical protein
MGAFKSRREYQLVDIARCNVFLRAPHERRVRLFG